MHQCGDWAARRRIEVVEIKAVNELSSAVYADGEVVGTRGP